jgi:hypothetical protein
MEATPRPWFIQERNDQHPYIVATTGDRYGVNIVYGNPTGGGAYFIGHEDVCRANAAFIVKAANAHDRLIEALEELEFSGENDRGTPGWCPVCRAYQKHIKGCQIDAALALARGEVE